MFADKIPQRFSILHVAARWGIPALVDYVSHLSYREYEAGRSINFDAVNSFGITPLEQAVLPRYPSVISLLLRLEAKVTVRAGEAAAGNWKGKEVIVLLLDWQGNQITITEELVMAAARNYRNVLVGS